MKKFLGIIFLATFIIYLISSPGITPYNYFTRLAFSFLHGKYYITENPSWLSELIKIGVNKFAVVYPPAPAILLMPFVALFGANFPQNIFANLVGAGITIVSAFLCFEITKNKTKTLWLTVLVAFGNIIWFMSSVGSVWYLGQAVSVLFLMLAITSLQKKLSPIIIGIFFGISFLSRVELIIALPFSFFLLENKKRFRFLLGLLPFILFYLLYNFLRFNNPLETGYSLIPRVLNEPWYNKGIISLSYIPRNLQVLLTSLPVSINNFPFLVPSWGGLAIWITTPAFIYSFLASFKEKSVKLAWFAIFSILFLISMHGETGYAQFGYRFAVDFYPFLIFLVIKYLSRNNLKWHHWLLLFLCIAVNTWGVILINKLGLISP
jgi:hypothetical protein